MSKPLQPVLVGGIKCYSPEEASRYEDYPDTGFDVTDRLEEDSFWVRSRNRLLKRMVETYSRHLPSARFLEIGCGTGAFIEHLASLRNLRVTGSEIYVKGLHYAKRRQPDVEFIQYDAKQGVLPDKFDVIAAFDVIEHIAEDVDTIANVHEMLADGGYFIVTVPQHKFLWSRLDQIVKHKRRYSRKELVAKLEQAGFEVVRRTSFLFALFPMRAVVRLLDRPAKDPDSLPEEDVFEDRVGFSRPVNWICDKVMRIDEALIGLGLSLPFGGTLLAVGQKRGGARANADGDGVR